MELHGNSEKEYPRSEKSTICAAHIETGSRSPLNDAAGAHQLQLILKVTPREIE